MSQRRNKKIWLSFDRILSHDLTKQVMILLIVLFVMFLLSMLMLSLSGTDWVKYCKEKNISRWVFPLYLLIDGNAFNNLYSYGISRTTTIIACIFYVAGIIVFSGMITSVMTNMISRRVEDHKNGLIHYLKSGHYIIMGYDDMVPSIINDIFINYPGSYILLLTSVEAIKVRERLLKSVASKYIDNVVINYGHRTTADYYKEIHLEMAEEIFIAGYRHLPAHDAVNIECVDSICDYLSNLKEQKKLKHVPRRITCVFEDLDTYAAFKTAEIFEEVGQLGIEFVPYNFYAGWARQVFVRGSYKNKEEGKSNKPKDIEYPTVYGSGITPEDNKFVHLVFVGTTNFAVAFAMEAAHVLHFPNYNRDKSLKTRITFIELNADKEKQLFVTRNRHFFEVQHHGYQDLSEGSKDILYHSIDPLVFTGEDSDFLDIKFEFIKGDVFSKVIQDELTRWANEENSYLSVFLTLADQRENFIMGMNMPDDFYDKEIPIFIRQDRSDNFVTNLRLNSEKKKKYSFVIDEGGNEQLETKDRKGRYSNIYPFGMNDMSYCFDELVLNRAKLINYLYSKADSYSRFMDISALNAISNDIIWAEANNEWSGLSVANKWSNLYYAYSIPCKLDSLRRMRGLDDNDFSHDRDELSLTEIEELAKVEHNRWNVEKLLMGYRKARKSEDRHEHDEIFNDSLSKNKKLFIHSDILPFEKLGDIQGLDKEFSRYIPWIIKMTEHDN